MYLFGVKYCYNLDRLQIACCHLVFVKKSPSFQNVDIFPELDRCTPFIGTVARFSRNKSLLISFGAPVITPTRCCGNGCPHVRPHPGLANLEFGRV